MLIHQKQKIFILRRDESGDRLARDKDFYNQPKHWAARGELSDVSEEFVAKEYSRGRSKRQDQGRYHQEDPYYHGLSARPMYPHPVSKQDKESINFNQAAR